MAIAAGRHTAAARPLIGPGHWFTGNPAQPLACLPAVLQPHPAGGGLVRPRLNWTGIKNTTLSVGVDIFTGANDGYFGRYNERDRVYGEVRFAF